MSTYRDDTAALRDLFGSLQGQLLDDWSRWPKTLRRRVERTLVEKIEALLSMSAREVEGFTAKIVDRRARSIRDVTEDLAEAGRELGIARQGDTSDAPALLDPTLLLSWAPLNFDRLERRSKVAFSDDKNVILDPWRTLRVYQDKIDQALHQEAFEVIEDERLLHPSWYSTLPVLEPSRGVMTDALLRYRGRPFRVHIDSNAAFDGNVGTFEGEDRFAIATYVDALVGSLAVTPEGYRHMLIRPFRSEDVEFSESAFDGIFWVRAEEPQEGRVLLSEEVRQTLSRLARNAIPTLKLKEGVLTMTWKWTVNSKDLSRAISAMDKIATQAEAMHQRRLAQLRAPK
ncbi:MAG: hypothetical protein KAI47_04440 [Deltaproteobacteria bacterium]|nr:hypothetical protein [Deltaproteobacteria bacterium]